MKNNKSIYLDNAATTSIDNEVAVLYKSLNEEYLGNPSSIHSLGVSSSSFIRRCKENILKSLSIEKTHDLLFTSGATEALNLAIKGYCLKYKNRGNHIITSNVEHPAVKESIAQLERLFGFKVTTLSVNKDGVIDVNELEQSMSKDTILVAIMSTNNEVGSINDLLKIKEIVKKYPKCNFLSDTTQSIGKDNINYSNIDMFVCSAHKIHGLKGSGFLCFKKNLSFEELLSGGGQQNNLRSGTESPALAGALDFSVSKALKNQTNNNKHAKELRDYLVNKLSEIDGIQINSNQNGSPFIVNFSLLTKKASVVVEALSLRNIFVSSVSACHSKNEPISNVVLNMTGDMNLAKNTVRVSFDENSSKEEIDDLISNLKEIMGSIR